LEILPETDPTFASLNSSLIDFGLLAGPFQCNFLETNLVRFTQQHFVYRICGGKDKASQCGFWWNLDPPQGNLETHFEHFAVCPEWNDSDNLVRCTAPKDFTALVGSGQSATGADTSTLAPDPTILQLNSGGICGTVGQGGADDNLTCEWCGAEDFSLEECACIAASPIVDTDELDAGDGSGATGTEPVPELEGNGTTSGGCGHAGLQSAIMVLPLAAGLILN